MRSFRVAVALLTLAITAPLLGRAQSVTPVRDFKSITGKWTGTGHSPSGTNPLEWTIKEDGTVKVTTRTPSGPRSGTAKLSIENGKLFYDSVTSSGPVTLEQNGARRILKYEAIFKQSNARGGAQLRAAK